MKEQKELYAPLSVEVVEVKLENGYSTTVTPTPSNAPSNIEVTTKGISI